MPLNRTLGLSMLTFYGTGMILGAGIYSIIVQAAGIKGDGLWLAGTNFYRYRGLGIDSFYLAWLETAGIWNRPVLDGQHGFDSPSYQQSDSVWNFEGSLTAQNLFENFEEAKTPWVAALVGLLIAVLLLPFSKVETLASIASFATMIVFIAVNAALIRLRRRKPQENRPFRIPFSIKTVPILPALGIAVCFTFLFQFDQLVYLTGLFAFMSSAGIYFLCRRFVGRSSNA